MLHLDSGDNFQGALVFNEFAGEAEMRLMSEIGLDAAVVANHEFDNGAHNLAHQYGAWGGFDLLAANYDFEDGDYPWAPALDEMILPSRIYDLDGLRVGVIGLANISQTRLRRFQLHGHQGDRARGGPSARSSILRSQGAEIVIALSHMGLRGHPPREDYRGHRHLHWRPSPHRHSPADCRDQREDGTEVPVVHSGAFAKFVGRVDFVIRDGVIQSFDHVLRPVANYADDEATSSSLKPEVVDILE